MTRLLGAAAIGCALFLAGCQTPAPTVTVGPVAATKADTAIARASVELVRYCGLTRGALAAVGIFASPKVVVPANYASAVVETVCTAPPSDVPTALATIGRAYQAVVVASAE